MDASLSGGRIWINLDADDKLNVNQPMRWPRSRFDRVTQRLLWKGKQCRSTKSKRNPSFSAARWFVQFLPGAKRRGRKVCVPALSRLRWILRLRLRRQR